MGRPGLLTKSLCFGDQLLLRGGHRRLSLLLQSFEFLTSNVPFDASFQLDEFFLLSVVNVANRSQTEQDSSGEEQFGATHGETTSE